MMEKAVLNMTLFYRRLLTILFLLVFLFLAPLMLLYADGFRYNFSSKRLEKVGLLYVTADPKDTKIKLDGQEHKVGNELILRSIKPGKHQITASLDGYYSWTKNLEIEKGKSTFINDLILFSNTPADPFELFGDRLILIKKTPRLTFYQNENFLITYDLKTKEIFEVELENKETIQNIVEGANNKTSYFKQNDNWFKAGFGKGQLKNITAFVPIDTKLLKETPSHLFALADNGVFLVAIPEKNEVTPTKKTTPSLPEKTISTPFISQPLTQDILQSDNNFWFLGTEPSKQRSFLYFLQDGSSRPHLITSLPYSKSYIIAEDIDGFLTIHDTANNILYLIDTAPDETTVATLNGVHTWQWSKDHSQLLTATEFELIIYHVNNGLNQELLLRLSNPITDTAWYTTESHVFYVSENKLFIVERDQRDQINIFELIDTKNNLQILDVDEDGSFIRLTSDFGQDKPGFIFWKKELR